MEIGFKGFDMNLSCRGVQYTVGMTMPKIKQIKICKRGYHFCRELKDLALWQWYKVDKTAGNRFGIVEPSGRVIDNGPKSVAQEIRVIREMQLDEVEELLNCSGNGNVGIGNNGNGNKGKMNYGDGNTGSWNIGDYNNGICNIGKKNMGSFNNGDANDGCFNTASNCIGWFNTKEACRGCFNVDGVKYIKLPTLIWEMLYGWKNYIVLTSMTRNEKFDQDRFIIKPWNKKQKRMYKLVELNDTKTAIKHGASLIIWDYSKLTMDLWELKNELLSMQGFNWEIFEEITGISEKWLDMVIEKAIKAR